MDKLVRVEDVKTDHRRFLGYLDEDMITRLNMTLEKNVPTIKAIPLDRIKQAREEINKLDTKIAIRDTPQGRESYFIVDQAEVLKILDKLIAESEVDNG